MPTICRDLDREARLLQLDAQLIQAIRLGGVAGVQAALASGARLHSRHVYAQPSPPTRSGQVSARPTRYVYAQPLQAAAANGMRDIVLCLLAAGAHVHTDKDRALLWAAQNGHAPVVHLLREYGAHLKPVLPLLHTFPSDAQVAAICNGDVAGLSAIDLTRQGVCPEALCVLLNRQGQAALAAMLGATQILAPLTPEDRAAMLGGFLRTDAQPESPHV